MRAAIPTLETVVETVARAADREGFTPHGLLDYLNDIDNHPEVYGVDLVRDRIIERILGGTGVEPEDITSTVCRMAQHWHRERMREMVRRWQKEADEKKVPVLYVLDGDGELGWRAVMRGMGTPEAPAVVESIKKAPSRSKGDPMLLGVPLANVVRWMGHDGWDLADTKQAVEYYGGEAEDSDMIAWLQEGRATPTAIPEDVQGKLKESLED